MRLRCAATVADREYEKAVDICSSALKVATTDRTKNEILFNRATAYIPLAMSGITPKGLSRATEDLKSVLRTEQHSRAALLLEKINLIKGGEGKGEPQSGDQKGRPDVQMFDEAPPASGAGGNMYGY
jgi:lipopolysaccharide biosynthesis regulator YciM